MSLTSNHVRELLASQHKLRHSQSASDIYEVVTDTAKIDWRIFRAIEFVQKALQAQFIRLDDVEKRVGVQIIPHPEQSPDVENVRIDSVGSRKHSEIINGASSLYARYCATFVLPSH